MNSEQRLHFRDAFRTARASALDDAEGFDELLFALERLGKFLYGQPGNMGKFAPALVRLASTSYLAEAIPRLWREFHIPFDVLLAQLRRARNAALHEGAFARHLTSHAVTISLILEDALMEESDRVGDYMVRAPVCAGLWQPLSFVRQSLLAHSFSFMPVNVGTDLIPQWRLVSDLAIATFLRGADNREKALGITLKTAVDSGGLLLSEPLVCAPDKPVRKALENCKGLPILVVSDTGDRLLGIATAYDLI